jgi:hypothetical protein
MERAYGRPSPAKTWKTLGAAVAAYTAGYVLDLQNKLPESLDVPAHMGNVVGSVVIGNLIGGLVAERCTSTRMGKEMSGTRVRTAAAAASLFVAAAVNGFVELRTGTPLVPFDTHDFVYGTVAGAAVGVAAPTATSVPSHQHEASL